MVGSSGLGPPRVTVRISVRAGGLLPATSSCHLGAAVCGGESWGAKAHFPCRSLCPPRMMAGQLSPESSFS